MLNRKTWSPRRSCPACRAAAPAAPARGRPHPPPTRRRHGRAAAARSTSPRPASRRPRSGPPGGPGGPRRTPGGARVVRDAAVHAGRQHEPLDDRGTAGDLLGPHDRLQHRLQGYVEGELLLDRRERPGGAGLVEAHLGGQRGLRLDQVTGVDQRVEPAGWSQPAEEMCCSISSTADARAGSGSGPSGTPSSAGSTGWWSVTFTPWCTRAGRRPGRRPRS